jgi:hypothetical protein
MKMVERLLESTRNMLIEIKIRIYLESGSHGSHLGSGERSVRVNIKLFVYMLLIIRL